ncbi:hypothetical protein AFCDBAGC_1977 [Methylobacterium cerastii]|uniref:Uncharacterized protein n=1 Tax=Methylobacterium cerastii TaxID=932741 RepID=A0ABQ4QFY3_9HYPH|nr:MULTISPECIES: hypothetical protein [Methylobacterium]TXM66069.1 hypothetical protein FV229_13710 [Methylobacterium sp. WL120]TXN00510.1 hypothetical protein FV222_11755 [Methylobacterium sp. WL103]TXN81594.1 hypothetical protein FV234_13150 [Methylobacterium sp. WL8]GJD44113.1 hypothetical protein AFCDBAGC_1977 [Methylobacterium cerastii]
MIARDVRHRARWAAICFTVLLVTPAHAEPDDRIAACDTLVSLRLLATANPDRAAALAAAAGRPGCKAVSRADVGAVEHRAMIGGAPFECLAVKGESACLWVQP